MPGTIRNDNADILKLARLLEDLKRLTILQLIVAGVSATQIAKALGVDKSAVSRLVPARALKRRPQ